MSADRLVFHIDMDAFFASIEVRDEPAYRGKPLIVGGGGKRGVVATCSYEARRFGVHSAQPMVVALRKCPEAIVVSPRMKVYAEASATIMKILGEFSPTLEPLSLDEAFMDMTGTEGLFGPPVEAAQALKDRIRAETELTSSVGISRNKFLAKLASDLEKPDGITLVPFGDEVAFIAPLSIRKIWGVGPKSAERLERLGLFTIGDVAAYDLDRLRREVGRRFADHIHDLAHARDPRQVIPDRSRKSVGSESTLSVDIRGREAVERVLRAQCERVGIELRRKGFKANGVRVKVRYSETFQLNTRQGPLDAPTDDSRTLFAQARGLLAGLDLDLPIRLVGAAAFELQDNTAPSQLGLFGQTEKKRNENLERTLDAIQARFGTRVMRGSDVPDE